MTSHILEAVIKDLVTYQGEADRAIYDRTVRTYFKRSAYADMMEARIKGTDAIKAAARRLY